MFARIKRVNSTGKGMILTFPTEAPSFPDYGTELARQSGIDYTSGISVSYNGVTYWGQYGDYVTYADGFGGQFYSWENVNYKSGYIYTGSETLYVTASTNSGPKTYPSGSHSWEQYWDEMGGSYGTNESYSYEQSGNTFYTDVYPTADTDGSYYFVEDGNSGGDYKPRYCYYLEYKHDGNGGYYTYHAESSYWPNGTQTGVINYWMPVMPPDDGARWSGKYCYVIWDGMGNSYIDYSNVMGNYWSSGTEYWSQDITQKANVYLSAYGYYQEFDNGKTDHNHYYWDGNGGYYNSAWTDGDYYPNDTEFANDGLYSYRWDGYGMYFTVPV